MDFAPDHRAELSSLENTLLWSMRACAIGLGKQQSVDVPITKVFTRLGASEAAKQMQHLLFVIGHGAWRMIELDCVCKPYVSGDEKTLLTILALTQHARFSEALSLLRSLLTPDAAIIALDSSRHLMASLTSSGWFLTPPPHATQFGYKSASESSSLPHQLVTLH